MLSFLFVVRFFFFYPVDSIVEYRATGSPYSMLFLRGAVARRTLSLF